MLTKPRKYKQWLIFPNTMPQEEHMLHCSNTVTGVCPPANTLQKCIDECEDHKNCDFGYYIQGNCLNLDKTNFPLYFNPSLYWENTDDDVISYINTNKLPFPQLLSNAVYFNDKIFLKSKKKDLLLETPFSELKKHTETINPINFVKDIGTILVVSFPNPFNPKVIENTNLLYEYPMVLRIKNTSYILRDRGKGMVTWILRGDTEISDDDKIYLYPIDNVGDRARYGETFRISIGKKGILGITPTNHLKIYYYKSNEGVTKEFIEDLNDKEISTIFEFIPQVSVYYCENNECKDIPLTQTVDGKFNDKDTYRRSDCFGLCSTDKEMYTNPRDTASIVVVVCVFIIVIIVLLVK